MNDNVTRTPMRSLKEQFSRGFGGLDRGVASDLSVLGRGRLVGLTVL